MVLATAAAGHAQDLTEAKKAIDAEQFEKAKSLLKAIIKENPKSGKANFILGNVYMNQAVTDSAKIYFENGLKSDDDANFNYIGLGELDLEANNVAAAKANFELAKKPMRRKDVEEFIYIGKAYNKATNPDYKSAIAILNQALAIEPENTEALVALGDAYYGDSNQNEAYKSYRSAFAADNKLLRAKMQLGVLLKGAKSYDEAVKSLNEVIAMDPNYGPAYRELAETYYNWGRNRPSTSEANMKKAILNYEKYLSLTDYSMHSRMRHADFLILVEDYAALEVEANKMIELDKVNPRIYRYLGYSAYENGNIDVAIKSLQDYINNPVNKVIAKDHIYLGLAKIKKGTSADGTSVDPVLFDEGLKSIQNGVDLEISATNDLGEIGKDFYTKKLFKEAAAILQIATTNKETTSYLYDNFYLGNAIYFANAGKPVEERDMEALKKGDIAYGNVLEASPETIDAYIYRARTNSLLEDDAAVINYYQQYIDHLAKIGEAELTKPANKAKVLEAYNSIGAAYANSDKVKALEYFNKTLAIDPANEYAVQSIASLK